MKRVAWRQLGGLLEDTLWPPLCARCRLDLPDGRELLCAGCREKLTWIESRYCLRCGVPADRGEAADAPGWICRPCRRRRWAFSFAVSALRHEGLARELLHHWKLQREERLGPVLGRLLAGFDEQRLRPWVAQGALVVPVPMGPLRCLWRGFDQSVELARAWARPRRLRVACALRRRENRRGRQIGRSKIERGQGWDGVFVVCGAWRRELSQRPVILVDDVMTTGATVHAAARVLREAGCPDVAVLTLMREV